jgi:hypothetical protein
MSAVLIHPVGYLINEQHRVKRGLPCVVRRGEIAKDSKQSKVYHTQQYKQRAKTLVYHTLQYIQPAKDSSTTLYNTYSPLKLVYHTQQYIHPATVESGRSAEKLENAPWWGISMGTAGVLFFLYLSVCWNNRGETASLQQFINIQILCVTGILHTGTDMQGCIIWLLLYCQWQRQHNILLSFKYILHRATPPTATFLPYKHSSFSLMIYFTCLRKTAKSYKVRHVSVCPPALINSAPTGRIFITFDI